MNNTFVNNRKLMIIQLYNPGAYWHVYEDDCGHLVCNLGFRLTIASAMMTLEQTQTKKGK